MNPSPVISQATMAPADLLLSLLAMQTAGFEMPDIALMPNAHGLSIVTSWLHERFARLCSAGYRPETPTPDFIMGALLAELRFVSRKLHPSDLLCDYVAHCARHVKQASY